MKKKRQYTLTELMDKFDTYTHSHKEEVLWLALDIMQSYNGRSSEKCVALAMGYSENEEGLWGY